MSLYLLHTASSFCHLLIRLNSIRASLQTENGTSQSVHLRGRAAGNSVNNERQVALENDTARICFTIDSHLHNIALNYFRTDTEVSMSKSPFCRQCFIINDGVHVVFNICCGIIDHKLLLVLLCMCNSPSLHSQPCNDVGLWMLGVGLHDI